MSAIGARSRRGTTRSITAWNGLAIAGLAEAGALLDEPEYLGAAMGCARHVLDQHWVSGRLRRSSRAGVVGPAAGVAEDYGDLAEGLLALHQATADPQWLRAAGELLDTAMAHFSAEDGGFYDAADDAEALFTRPRDPGDNASPAGQSAIVTALVAYAARQIAAAPGTGRGRDLGGVRTGDRSSALRRLDLAAAEALVSGPVQVAMITGTDTGADNLVGRREPTWPASRGSSARRAPSWSPARPMRRGFRCLRNAHWWAVRAAYVCRAMVCDRPHPR